MYRSDLHAAHEQISQLQAKVQNLSEENEVLKEKRKGSRKSIANDLTWLVILFSLFLSDLFMLADGHRGWLLYTAAVLTGLSSLLCIINIHHKRRD